MKYYRMCQKILGYEIFSKLVDYLLIGISEKFGKEITVDEFGKILEINIDALMMLSIAYKFPEKGELISHQIKISLPYLVTDTLDKFASEMDYYIKEIAKGI